MPTFGPLGQHMFHISLYHTLTHSHTHTDSRTSALTEWCSTVILAHIAKSLHAGFRAADPPGLQLAQTQTQVCPLVTGDYLPRCQEDGCGPDAAHTLHHQVIIAVGTIAAIYCYQCTIPQLCQPNDTDSPWRNV